MERKEFEIAVNHVIHLRISRVSQPSVALVVFSGLIQIGEGKTFENSRVIRTFQMMEEIIALHIRQSPPVHLIVGDLVFRGKVNHLLDQSVGSLTVFCETVEVRHSFDIE